MQIALTGTTPENISVHRCRIYAPYPISAGATEPMKIIGNPDIGQLQCKGRRE